MVYDLLERRLGGRAEEMQEVTASKRPFSEAARSVLLKKALLVPSLASFGAKRFPQRV